MSAAAAPPRATRSRDERGSEPAGTARATLLAVIAGYLLWEPPLMPRIIIHTIAPIIAMHGIAKNRKPTFTPATPRMTASAMTAAQPHIIFM